MRDHGQQRITVKQTSIKNKGADKRNLDVNMKRFASMLVKSFEGFQTIEYKGD